MNGSIIPTTTNIPANPMITIESRAHGILCFNTVAQLAEIGYSDIHDLFISVWDSSCRVMLGPDLLMRGETLEIINPGSSSRIGESYENGTSDRRNLSRMYELSRVYDGANVGFADDARTRFQSRFYINEAVFATEPSTVGDADVFPEDDQTSTRPAPQTGRILNIFSRSRDNDLTLKFGTREITLSRSESYFILIENGNCRTPIGEGDFKHYFEFLKEHGKPRHNLKFRNQISLPIPPCKRRNIAELSEQLIEYENKGSEPFEIPESNFVRWQQEADEFARRLETLAAVIKCAPAACQKATFIDKSRSIPV